MRMALGWACNLNDLFVRFTTNRCPNLRKMKTGNRRLMIKKVFRTGCAAIINDIIENNVTFELPTLGYYKGEIHCEAVKGSEFERLRAKGKFAGIDFLETIFTGYQIYLYLRGKKDDFLSRRKFPIYISGDFKRRFTENINLGKVYC